ncbi:MAG: DUF5696 domain-containing protein [bacterium]
MRKVFIYCLLAALFFVFISSYTLVVEAADLQSQLDDYKRVNESRYLTLYINENTTEIAVYDKRNGEIWFSSPPDLEEMEQRASGKYKDKMKSPFSINYYDPQDKRQNMDPYNDSINLDNPQYEIKEINNGIEVEYLLGEEYNLSDLLPEIISVERFENEISSGLSKEDGESLREEYLVYTLEELEKNEEWEISGLDNEEIFSDYKIVFHSQEYQNLLQDKKELEQKKKELESEGEAEEKISELETEIEDIYWEIVDYREEYTYELFDIFVDNRDDLNDYSEISINLLKPALDNPTMMLDSPPRFIKDEMVETINGTDYSFADVNQDYIENNLGAIDVRDDIFTVTIRYQLDGDELLVKVPSSEIMFPDDYPLTNINLLEHFGAGNAEETGYIFVPDGSGSLINLNNDKNYADMYNSRIYGSDKAIWSESSSFLKQSYLPVYGLKKGDKALFAIIENGDSFANIRADINGGGGNSYNNVYGSFNILPETVTHLSASEQQQINIYQSRKMKQDIEIRYSFLYGSDANYVGMARYYQNYLQKKGMIGKKSTKGDLPFFLDLIGSIPVEKSVMGIPREVQKPLTTYQQVEEIIEKLTDQNIDNIKVKYSGWQKGGLKPYYPDQVEVAESLGDKKDFGKLFKFFNHHNIDFYPAVEFLNIYRDNWFDSFSPRNDAAKYLNGLLGKNYDYSLSSGDYLPDNFKYLLSPGELNSVIKSFLADYTELESTGFSLEKMGEQLHSDFNSHDLIDRTRAQEIVIENMELIKNKKQKLLLNGANVYTLAYGNDVANIPLTGNNFRVTDRSVPFLQIVLQGLKDFAGIPFNKAKSPRYQLLKSIETGAGFHFQWSYARSQAVKESEYQDLFSLHYGDWITEATELYSRARQELAPVQGKKIKDHQLLQDGVYKTTYEGQVSVIVNYNEQKIQYQDQEILPEDYIVLEEVK